MQGYSSLILKGALVTIELAISSLVLAMILGVICALGKLSRKPILQLFCQVYTSFIRGVPDLVLINLTF